MNLRITFIDYEVNPAGFAESLTWSQVHQRAQVVAEKLLSCGSPGERAAILAPQGLEYVVAFLGAIQAGFIAVPLSVPQFGTHDERVSGVLRDCSPVAVLTTSAVVDDIRKYAQAQPRARAPRMIEIDALDFDSPRPPTTNVGSLPKTAYLQYTSGSTRAPAGVVVTHKNVRVNLEQLMTDFFEDQGNFPPPDTTVVSWLPFYHDMGLVFGVFMPAACRTPGSADESGVVHAETGPVDATAGQQRWFVYGGAELRVRIGGRNARRMTTWPGSTSVTCGSSSMEPNEFTPRRSGASLSGSRSSTCPDTALRPSYGLAEATLYVSTSAVGTAAGGGTFRLREVGRRPCEAVRTEGGSELVSCGPPRSTDAAHRRPRDRDRESGRQGRGDLDARRQRRHGLLAQSAADASEPSVDSWSIRRRARRTGRGCAPGTWE